MSTDQQHPDGRSEPAVPSIPLVDDNAYASGIPGSGSNGQSIGSLAREVTTHLSTLVRAEIELAKLEVAGEAKRALKGGIFFAVALTVLLFSTFFFFMALAELLADVFGLYRSAAYGIVFGLMIVVAAVAGLLGYLKVRKIRAPQRTIDSAKDTVAALSKRGGQTSTDVSKP